MIVELDIGLALLLTPEAELYAPPTSFTSVCISDWIWVSSPSESNVANCVTNWLGSTGFIGLWFSSCVDSNCKNVLVRSTPLSVDEDEDVEEEPADEEEDVAPDPDAAFDRDAAGVEVLASICNSEMDMIFPS
ncbi:MAG: hypothetical protein WAM89_05145 [Terriglobales bacterium]